MLNKTKIGAYLMTVALGTSLAVAGPVYQAKEIEKIIEDNGIFVETSQKGITLSGYVDVSYNYNFNGGTADRTLDGSRYDNNNRFPGRGGPNVGGRQFDVDSNDFSVNQVKLALEKALPEKNTWAAGFRIDLMFGEDAKYIAGNDDIVFGDSGSASLQQAYVNFRIPVGNGLDVKFGKFVTLLGYEVIETPSNINVTRSLNFTYAIPLHHTGILFTYPLSDLVELSLGLVNGWNNEDSNFLDGSDFSKAFTGHVKVKNPGGNAVTALSFIYSPEGESAINNALADRALVGTPPTPSPGVDFNENSSTLVFNWWGEWIPKFANNRLLLAFELNFGLVEDNYGYTFQQGSNPNSVKGFGKNSDMWYGLALYAKYQVNDLLSLASRFEYFKDQDGTARLADSFTALSKDDRKYGFYKEGAMYHTNVDIFSWTLTAGFDIWENMLLRVEYRADYLSSNNGNDHPDWDIEHLFNSTSALQHSLILNASYSF
jgi:hypothetical protein